MNIKDFRVGSVVEAKDFFKWLKATVIEVDEVNIRVKVHYDGQDARFDEWLGISDGSVRLFLEGRSEENMFEETRPEENMFEETRPEENTSAEAPSVEEQTEAVQEEPEQTAE